MTGGAASVPDHGALMDSVYRGQRHIYDATRKYFLFGRDRLIEGLDCAPGQAVLEVGCGTGRNLALMARRWPGISLHGLDISGEMLKSAQTRLGDGATLVRGDATAFDTMALFGREGFDRVILSFALSMIPDWKMAVGRATDALAPGAALHIVDFGLLGGLPAPLRAALRAWLARFHVTIRTELGSHAQALAEERGLRCAVRDGPLGYYRQIAITRPAG